jgi:acetyltransferase-like isoleucine patch superfamily enzyme
MLLFVRRILTAASTAWLRLTYPFAEFGIGASVDFTTEVRKSSARHIAIGSGVLVGPDAWLNVVARPCETRAVIEIGQGSQLGRRCVISAKNGIRLERDVLLGPNVLIMDHNHAYADPRVPIALQGTTDGGSITIGRNCWLGYGSVVICSKGELIIGENSVIGANAVVTRSVPPRSIVAGNPARVVRQYDETRGEWMSIQPSEQPQNRERLA